MSSTPEGDPSVCYKSDNCNYDYCVEKKNQEQCYWSSDCQYNYCIKTGYQPMTTAQTNNDTDIAKGKSTYYLLFIQFGLNYAWY